jgi:lantibiotic biosynthesis protein
MAETLTSVGFFVLRTPTLSWDVIEKWCRGLSLTRTLKEGGDIKSALRADITILRTRLRSLVKHPAVQSALYIGSPNLFAKLGPWLDGDESERACSVEPAIVRYMMRTAGRATPFGLFAGTSIGTIDQHISLAVSPMKEHVRHTRIDAEYVFELADELSRNPALLPDIRFKVTTALYNAGGRLRYYEPHFSGKWRKFHLVDVEPTPYLHAALDVASNSGGSTMSDIAKSISSSFDDVLFADAFEYVNSLVEAKLLCDTFSPALTGRDPVLELVEKLRESNAGESLAIQLTDILASIELADVLGLEAQPEHYSHIASRLKLLHRGIHSSRVLRIDLRKPVVAATISPAIVNDVRRGIELLAAITDQSDNLAMRRFVREFMVRYQGNEVPLLQGLDEETGIGFDADGDSGSEDSSLLEGTGFNRSPGRTIDWNSRTAFLFQKLSEALRNDATEIALSDMDIKALSSQPAAELPKGLSVLAAIAAASGEAADRGEYRIHVRKVFGPNSGKLLGRFCEGDVELQRQVERTLRREEACDPDAIHAEIVHLPHRHAGNVICRPVLREYEIPLFDRSGASEAQQILLSDLFVSVQRGKVVLRSASRGRRVVPHLTCAHAFRKSGLGLYRFLASLEEQGTFSELSFSWGPLASAPYLPRVVHGKVVLSLAQWNASTNVLRRIHALQQTEAFVALQELQARLKLPRFVMLMDGDNRLPVDFENALSLWSFVKVAKQGATFALSEIFPAPNELLVSGEGGHFHHELIIPFVQRVAVKKEGSDPAIQAPLPYRVDRKKYPGSNWLFVKIYCGVAMVDRVLGHLISPLVAELRVERAIDRWFFIRHSDPQWHLRLRLRGEPSHLWKDVAPRLFASLSSTRGIIHNVMVDSYEPEEERYGGEEALDIAEKLFEADSDTALSIIQDYGGNVEARWRLALCGMDALLSDFGFSLGEKKHAMEACRFGQASQYEHLDHVQRQIGNRYRKLRPEIETLLRAPQDLYARGVQAIHIRSQKLVEIAAALQRLDDEGCLRSPRTAIVGSYLHMWANRILRSSINAQEMVLYEFLYRIYDGQMKRDGAKQV